jgi:hypothetical protein
MKAELMQTGRSADCVAGLRFAEYQSFTNPFLAWIGSGIF